MIQIQNKVDCCGCNACGDICAHGAITFKTDNEGFWYPEVNKELCVDCGLCEKVCPIINIDKLKHNDLDNSECHAAIHKNLEVRFDSTSGGLFSALAEKMYRDGGYVGGALYDENYKVRHFISNNKKDLLKLRSSKYTESNAEGFYIRVKELLNNGEKVLVCGTPCQMAALRSFLRKQYDNLIVVDFVCRGVNSPFVGKKFIESLEKKWNSKIIWQKAKNKELGWKLMAAKYITEDGKSHFIPAPLNAFTRGYLKTNAFCRPSCYKCKFKGMPRMSDLSLADCWGIERIDKSMDDNIGTSLVLVNSKKGIDYYNNIMQKIKSIDVTLEQALVGNPAIMRPIPEPSIDREKFFEYLKDHTFEETEKKYFPYIDNNNFKKQITKNLKPFYKMCKYSYGSIWNIFRLIKLNFFTKEIIRAKGKYIYLGPHTIIDIRKGAKIILNDNFLLGYTRVLGSKSESRLLIESGGIFQVDSRFGAGIECDFEVFSGAKLVIHDDFGGLKGGGPNMGCTIICGNSIEIGEDCRIGRHVTIRDNNGGHYINMQGYKTSKPIVIGKHVWLCEGCTIMQGVKIGDGAIVAAGSLVLTNVPPYSLVSGNPAKVVQTDIHWKY